MLSQLEPKRDPGRGCAAATHGCTAAVLIPDGTPLIQHLNDHVLIMLGHLEVGIFLWVGPEPYYCNFDINTEFLGYGYAWYGGCAMLEYLTHVYISILDFYLLFMCYYHCPRIGWTLSHLYACLGAWILTMDPVIRTWHVLYWYLWSWPDMNLCLDSYCDHPTHMAGLPLYARVDPCVHDT